MLISCRDIQKQFRQMLSGFLAILLTLVSLVRAQENQSQTQPADQKRIASKAGDKEPQPARPDEVGTEEDAKLAVYQVHRLAEKILALRSVRAKAVELARLASALWKYDEPHARSLFEKALNMTIANGSDREARALSFLHRRVIALVARNDPEWAKRLIDTAAKREADDPGSKTAGDANITTALDLLEEDPTVAAQFAERGLKAGLPWGFLDFIKNLRRKDEPEANRLFLQALMSLAQQPAVNIKDFHTLGVYLFTAPGDSPHPDARTMTVVGDILVANITVDRPGVPPALVRSYLATAADILWRTTSDAEQRKYSYALCYMLLPKAKNVAPDLIAKFDAIMATLTPNVPPELTKDSAFRYLNPAPKTTEERLTNAENKPTQEERDMAYLDIISQAWWKGDFKTARIAQARISDLAAAQRLATIIDFGDGAWTIKEKRADFSKVEALANRMPQGIERSILLQAIAKIQSKGPRSNSTEETIDKASKAARSISDGRRPFLLLTSAAQLADLKSPAVHGALAEAVKDFNSFEESALTRLDWVQSIQIGPYDVRFPLNVPNIEFDFDKAFRAAALADPEAAMARAEELRHENLRAQGLVEVAKAFLEKAPAKESEQNEQAIRVDEHGMRKSASKTVMPSYPQDAIKKREQGVTVVELVYDAKGDVVNTAILEAPSKSVGDSVIAAVRQWKFVPSKREDGTPVSIRGKLTFYFEIDKDGKGQVLNPKQYR
ncbi:MAG TPA: energy transducer TonB [Pyrinomonadaceae bacterium]|nr:energy transducer TonB [Pyrinomonadaceae bacterium]